MVLEAESVSEPFAPSAVHDGADTAVIFQGWADIPTIGGVKVP